LGASSLKMPRNVLSWSGLRVGVAGRRCWQGPTSSGGFPDRRGSLVVGGWWSPAPRKPGSHHSPPLAVAVECLEQLSIFPHTAAPLLRVLFGAEGRVQEWASGGGGWPWPAFCPVIRRTTLATATLAVGRSMGRQYMGTCLPDRPAGSILRYRPGRRGPAPTVCLPA